MPSASARAAVDLRQAQHPPSVVQLQFGQTRGDRGETGRQGDLGPGLAVGTDQLRIVHAVDEIARQQQNQVGTATFEQKAVLRHRIDTPGVPGLAGTHLWRDRGDELAKLGVEDTPAVAQVLVQGVGLVLGQDQDAAQP